MPVYWLYYSNAVMLWLQRATVVGILPRHDFRPEHIKFAPHIGKEYVEKIKVSIAPFTENILGGSFYSYKWNYRRL